MWRFSAKIKTKKFLFKILLQINSAHISPSTSTEGQGALHTVEQKCWGTKKATIQQKYCKNPKMLRRHVGKETGATWHVRGHNSGNRTEVIDRR